MENPEGLVKEILRIAEEAGRAIERYSPAAADTELKPDGSPVTQADLAADQLIRRLLIELNPTVPIISEESELPSYEERRLWNRFWLVDGLDGTKGFLAGRDEFTVNIALIEDGIPTLGVVHAPRKRVAYFGFREGGSWRVRDGEVPMRISSIPKAAEAPLVIVESRSHPSAELERFLGELPVLRRTRLESSLKFCMVAEGTADVYARFGPTSEWDVAAGDCIFRFSGIDRPRSSSFIYNKPDVRNGSFVIGLD